MAQLFEAQLNLLDGILAEFYAGTARVTLCVSSGISLRRMPSLTSLLSTAITALPQNEPAEESFTRYRNDYHFADALRAAGHEFPEPLTLQAFRGLSEGAKEEACKRLSACYGDAFQELIPLFGDKCRLLTALDFQRFQHGEPDAAHYYLAYLYIEGKLQRVVSLNWDCLIEMAVQRVGAGRPLNVIKDEPSFVRMNEGPLETLAKVHGCAMQYPDHCENIVITAADVEIVTAKLWVQTMLRDFLNGIVIYCGYRARDMTVNVPVRAIEELRQRNELPPANYYVAQEDELEARAFDALIHNNASRHIRLNANDLFCSIYFGWLRARLREVVQSGRSRTRVERPFDWADADWNTAMDRVNQLVEHELSDMLDHLIGTPDARTWESLCLTLPLNLSLARALFLDGKVEGRNTYNNLRFGDITHDLVMLVVLSALVDILRGNESLHLGLHQGYCGLTVRDSRTGSSRQIILYRGQFAPRSYGVLSAYLAEIEADGGIAPEIVVVPCEKYVFHASAPDLTLGRVLEKEFRGGQVAIKRFIPPDRILRAENLDALKTALQEELEVV